MADDRLLGRVFVVTGRAPGLPAVAAALVDAGAFVAFVSDVRSAPDAHASFRADPTNPTVWERVAPHVEQRLGPVDGVVTDVTVASVVEAVFATDLARRGHGTVLVVEKEDVDAVVSRLLGTL